MNDFETYTNQDILSLYADVLDELKERKLTRSRNNPVADYAERLVSQKLGLTLENNSHSGYDAISKDGIRYQIKSRRLDPTNKSRQLGVIRNYENGEFDYLIGVLFDRNFEVVCVYKIPHDCIEKHSRFSEHQNERILHLRGSILEDKEVRDITDMFKDSKK